MKSNDEYEGALKRFYERMKIQEKEDKIFHVILSMSAGLMFIGATMYLILIYTKGYCGS